MSKTLGILTAIALVWLIIWSTAGYFMHQAGGAESARADYLASPATRLVRGTEVRAEGTLVDGASVSTLWSQQPCLAAVTDVSAVSHYQDSGGRTRRQTLHIATRRVGPESLAIAVGDQRVELPLERWSPDHQKAEDIDELPARFEVKAEEIDEAKERASGSVERFSVSETAIHGGTRVFVIGKLEDRDGPLRLDVDPVLNELVLFPGSRQEYVSKLRGSSAGSKLAGWILGAVVGPLPLLVIGLVVLARRRHEPGSRPTDSAREQSATRSAR